MLLKTRALLFRATKYGDSSLILEAYTEQRGIRTYIVSGVRKPRSTTPASLVQPMNLVDLVAYERAGKDMHRVKEVRPAHIYTRIPFDVFRGTIGLFMLEMARGTIREIEDNPALFQYLYDSFVFLDTTEGPVNLIHLHFLLNLSLYLGFLPAGEFSAATPLFDLREGHFTGAAPGHTEFLDAPAAELMYKILHAERTALQHIHCTRAARQNLLNDLVRFYRHHVEGMREIRSLEVLRSVF